jgi:hypothetical protein
MNLYWHGQAPFVKITIGDWPWEEKMLDEKYVMPEEMLKTVDDAITDFIRHPRPDAEPTPPWTVAVSAAMAWLVGELERLRQAADPPLDLNYLRSPSMTEYSHKSGYLAALSDVRQIFLAPGPKIPQPVKDIFLRRGFIDWDAQEVKDAVEAYQRGLHDAWQKNP